MELFKGPRLSVKVSRVTFKGFGNLEFCWCITGLVEVNVNLGFREWDGRGDTRQALSCLGAFLTSLTVDFRQ